MILIADSGSTKTDWVLLDENENKFSYKTIGFNPHFTDSETIYNSLIEILIPQFDPGIVKKVFFYGAGCASINTVIIVNNALVKYFSNATVNVYHDMLAAARALLGNQPGFAAILGTGSNTCIYNGKEIEKNIDSLGYLLGDEGSGSYIGKKIIRDYMRNALPPQLQQKFTQTYNLNEQQIFDFLYNKSLPNRFLASFCKFAHQYKEHEYIKAIIKESFGDFFMNLVSRYPRYQEFSFNCVGSVGFIFKDQLKEVATSYNMKMGRLIPSPINNLVNYHRSY
ncbi:MAG TPA: N-acetylglucosamine kinase [Bacteroidia bacterium]|jgi:glucosamine kinase|nr:N-acetylglucosamine kinase [Bacteroidia bacterium]